MEKSKKKLNYRNNMAHRACLKCGVNIHGDHAQCRKCRKKEMEERSIERGLKLIKGAKNKKIQYFYP